MTFQDAWILITGSDIITKDQNTGKGNLQLHEWNQEPRSKKGSFFVAHDIKTLFMTFNHIVAFQTVLILVCEF